MKKANSRLVERWRDDDRWSIESEWSGTAMIYAASDRGSFALSGDYKVSYEDESEPQDLRASRLFRAGQGEDVGEVPFDKLGEELLVIFGAKMTLEPIPKVKHAVGRPAFSHLKKTDGGAAREPHSQREKTNL